MWVVLALAAAFLWGVVYFFDEHVYRHISVTTSLAITMFIASIIFAVASYTRGHLGKDLATIFSVDHRTLLMMLVVLIATIGAELCIGLSIANKNATVAGLIEITYPLFVALIGYVLIKENNLNAPTMAAALLIFAGIGLITIFNR